MCITCNSCAIESELYDVDNYMYPCFRWAVKAERIMKDSTFVYLGCANWLALFIQTNVTCLQGVRRLRKLKRKSGTILKSISDIFTEPVVVASHVLNTNVWIISVSTEWATSHNYEMSYFFTFRTAKRHFKKKEPEVKPDEPSKWYFYFGFWGPQLFWVGMGDMGWQWITGRLCGLCYLDAIPNWWRKFINLQWRFDFWCPI